MSATQGDENLRDVGDAAVHSHWLAGDLLHEAQRRRQQGRFPAAWENDRRYCFQCKTQPDPCTPSRNFS